MGYGNKGKGGGTWVWSQGGDKGGGVAKGKGKGKKSKGKGKGEFGEPRKSTSYYYVDNPHLARGLPIVKCKNPICFGNVLFGANPPPICKECGYTFDYSRFTEAETADEEVERSRPPNRGAPPPSRDSSAGNSKDHKKLGEDLYNQLQPTLGEDEAAKITKSTFPSWTKVKPTVEPGASYAKSAFELKALENDIGKLKIKIREQSTKHAKLCKELDDCTTTGEALVATMNTKQAEFAAKLKQGQAVLGFGTVAKEKAKRSLGDTAAFHLDNIASYIGQSQADKITQDATMFEVLELVSAAELTVANANLEKDTGDKRIRDLEAQVKLLALTVNANAKAASQPFAGRPNPGQFGALTTEDDEPDVFGHINGGIDDSGSAAAPPPPPIELRAKAPPPPPPIILGKRGTPEGAGEEDMNAAEAEDVDVVAWNCQVKRVRGKRFNGKFSYQLTFLLQLRRHWR
jgi:hypothetical protein